MAKENSTKKTTTAKTPVKKTTTKSSNTTKKVVKKEIPVEKEVVIKEERVETTINKQTKKTSKFGLEKLLMLVIVVTLILTWFIKSGTFGTDYAESSFIRLGFLDLYNVIPVIFGYFGYYFLFIICIGLFYGILNATGAYNNLINKIVTKINNPSKFLIILISILTIFISITGFGIEIFLIIPFITAILYKLGYNKMTAALVFLGSIAAGLMGNTVGVYLLGAVIKQYDLTYTTNMPFKLLLLLIALLLIVKQLVIVSKNTDKEEKEKLLFNEEVNNNVPTLPLIIVLVITIIFSFLAILDINGAIENFTIFTKINDFLINFDLFGIHPFAVLLSSEMTAFGTWSFSTIGFLLILSTLILSFIYGIKFDTYLENAIKGIKRVLRPAIFSSLIFIVVILCSKSSIQTSFMNFVFNLSDTANVFTAFISSLIGSIFINDSLYIHSFVMIPFMEVCTVAGSIMGLIVQSLIGFSILVMPTNIVLYVALSYFEISYKEWIKTNKNLILQFLGLIFVVIVVSNMLVIK
ncbi:MAG: hypothetical protein ACK5HL_00250 [Bacilli bacterium]